MNYLLAGQTPGEPFDPTKFSFGTATYESYQAAVKAGKANTPAYGQFVAEMNRAKTWHETGVDPYKLVGTWSGTEVVGRTEPSVVYIWGGSPLP